MASFASYATKVRYDLPIVFGVGEARSHTPTRFSVAGGSGGARARRNSQCTRYETATMPAARRASWSPGGAMTAGFRPAGPGGTATWTVRNPPSSETSSSGAAGGAGTGRGGVTWRQATSHPASTKPVTHPRRIPIARIAASILLAAFASACARRPLLLEAIRARGGPLHAFVREVEAEVHAEGPLSLPPLGSGTVTVRFADFRRARRWRLPFRADYGFAGRPLATERTLSVCPDDPAVTSDAFRTPDALAACTAGRAALGG